MVSSPCLWATVASLEPEGYRGTLPHRHLAVSPFFFLRDAFSGSFEPWAALITLPGSTLTSAPCWMHNRSSVEDHPQRQRKALWKSHTFSHKPCFPRRLCFFPPCSKVEQVELTALKSMKPLCELPRAKGFLLLPPRPFPLSFSAGVEQKLNLAMGYEEKNLHRETFLSWLRLRFLCRSVDL